MDERIRPQRLDGSRKPSGGDQHVSNFSLTLDVYKQSGKNFGNSAPDCGNWIYLVDELQLFVQSMENIVSDLFIRIDSEK